MIRSCPEKGVKPKSRERVMRSLFFLRSINKKSPSVCLVIFVWLK